MAEQFTLRMLIHSCNEIIEAAYTQQEPPEIILDRAEKAILEISRFGKTKGFEDLGSILDKLFDTLEQVENFKKANPREHYFAGAKSGYQDIDDKLRGFHPGGLYILAARPSVGKTSLALNIALKVAKETRNGFPVLIFSLEMPSESLALRLLSSEAKIPIGKIEGAELNDDEWQYLTAECRAMSDCKILMNDMGAVSVRDIANTARRVVSRYGGISLLVVDYLQLVSSGMRTENRVNEVGAISRGLKSLALQLGVPILACSQLSRQVEQRKEQRPMLHDLRESGSIEQDADVVMFLSSALSKDSTGGEANTEEYKQVQNLRKDETVGGDYMFCTISKNRNGPTGECLLRFRKEFCRFDSGHYPDFISKKHPARSPKEGKK